jgi:signal transduction histidine kinase
MTLTLNILGGKVMINDFNQRLNNVLKAQMTNYISALTPPLRQQLLMGNIRGSRLHLHKYIEQGLIHSYQIYKEENLIDSYSSEDFNDKIEVSLPIYYSLDSKVKWGTLKVQVKTNRITGLISTLQNNLWTAAVIVTFFMFGILCLAFIGLWNTTKQLTPIMNSYLNERVPKKIGKYTSKLWSPLLLKINNQFLKSQNWKEEYLNSEKDAVKGRVTAQVAHDIRSPLAVLKFASEETSNDLVKSAHDKIQKIVTDLLEDRPSHLMERYDIKDLLHNLIEEKRIEYSSHLNLNLQVSSVDSSFELKILSIDLQRILSNLINNSIEAITTSQGEITISGTNNESSYSIIISDNGRGIPSDLLESVLTRGFSHNKEQGHGLGLSGAKEKVEALGGTLELSSQENKGTTVSISVPKKAIIFSEVVLLEDDELITMIWKQAAEKSSVNLTVYKDPKTLLNDLSLFDQKTHFYIDSDLGLDISGSEVAKEIYEFGHREIHMATGRSKDYFKEDFWLKSVLGKEPPF